jgi:hypothetical protein
VAFRANQRARRARLPVGHPEPLHRNGPRGQAAWVVGRFASQPARGRVTAAMGRFQFFKVRPEQLGRHRVWMADLAPRDEEVQATFRQETVWRELAYLIQGPEGPALVYLIEAADL